MNCFVYYCIYGSKVWLQSVNLQVGQVPGHSSIIAPILQLNILDLLSNTDIVIIPESELRIQKDGILLYKSTSASYLQTQRMLPPQPILSEPHKKAGELLAWLQEDGSHNLHSPVFIEEKFMEERNNQFLQFKLKLIVFKQYYQPDDALRMHSA